LYESEGSFLLDIKDPNSLKAIKDMTSGEKKKIRGRITAAELRMEDKQAEKY